MIDFPFKLFYGIVEDNNDPQKIGRVRVRCFGFHSESKLKIPTDKLPWATVMMPTTSASVSGIGISPSLLQGSYVIGFFRDGNECQDLVVIGTVNGYPVEVKGDVGFKDPDNTHPKQYNESDVNRLARNENTDGTYLKTKASNRKKSFEPESPYNAQYPHNQVIETECGHIIELDSTPNAERINIHHVSGSYSEIARDGRKVAKTVGDSYSITIKDKNVYVGGKANVTIDGDCSLMIKGDYDMSINGNHNMTVKGDYKITVNGKMDTDVSNKYNVMANTMFINGAEISKTGDVKTATGVSLDMHQHNQPPDTDGDAQSPTSPPIPTG